MQPERITNQPWQFLEQMSPLPAAIRYYEDFTDEYLSIERPEYKDVWKIVAGGDSYNLDFTDFPVEMRPFIKHWCAFQIQTFSPFTAKSRHYHLKRFLPKDICSVVFSSPTTIRPIWLTLVGQEIYEGHEMATLKSVLFFLCRFNLASWSQDYLDFLSTLPCPATDSYAGVRTGDVFLGIEEEAVLVEYFDNLARRTVSQPDSVLDIELRESAILMCSFQFGLRPMQIGMLKMSDVRIWHNVDGTLPSVHLTFKMIKQRSQTKALPLTRKVKHDWAPVFAELHARAIRQGIAASAKFFRTASSRQTAAVIINLTERLLPEKRSAMDLRHTAAQRLVDAGASQEEVAEFMGHSDLDTCLVYFQTSPNQAERVNRALGISEIYTQVVKIAHDRLISADELARLKGHQQIGGAPHGILITGIGGCVLGQPACPSNPVIACYGCRKFMPINDPDIHRKALDEFRSVVTIFSGTSRGDLNSPAYLQLRRTISCIQGIISEIEGVSHEWRIQE